MPTASHTRRQTPTTGAPLLTVAVVSSRRSLRLRWLLNALDDERASTPGWEVVVAYDSDDAETRQLLTDAAHRRCSPRGVACPPGTQVAARRNLAWRNGAGAHVLFSDDDMRAPPGWIRTAMDLAAAEPDVLIEGRTIPDPTDGALSSSPLSRKWGSRPPAPLTPPVNIVVPRTLLDAVGGFDEQIPGAGMIDGVVLAARVRRAGFALAAAPNLVAYSAIYPFAPLALAKRLLLDRYLSTTATRYPELTSLLTDKGHEPPAVAAARRVLRFAAPSLHAVVD